MALVLSWMMGLKGASVSISILARPPRGISITAVKTPGVAVRRGMSWKGDSACARPGAWKKRGLGKAAGGAAAAAAGAERKRCRERRICKSSGRESGAPGTPSKVLCVEVTKFGVGWGLSPIVEGNASQ